MTSKIPPKSSFSSLGHHGVTAIIDFETRSECDLRKCGAWVYSKDPSTEVLCMAWKLGDEPTKLWRRGDLFPIRLRRHIEDGGILEAHNAFFEYGLWNNCQRTWPRVDWDQWSCSAAKAARFGLPRKLETVCDVLKLPVQKDMAGHRLMLKMCKPRKPTRQDLLHQMCYGPWPLVEAKEWLRGLSKEEVAEELAGLPTLWHETEEDLARLGEYCIQDVEAEYALSNALPELSSEEMAVWRATQEINTLGIYCDVDFARQAIEVLTAAKTKANERMKELTDGAVYSCSQVAVLQRWLTSQGVAISDMTKKGVAKALEGDISDVAREALELRQVFSRASVSKYEAMVRRADPDDNRIRDHVRYHGAITGRWAGQGIQTQNYPGLRGRGMSEIDDIVTAVGRGAHSFLQKYPDPTDTLAACLRPTLTAAPGKLLNCADYSQIEARILMWLCWNEPMLQAMREGRNIYCEMGERIFGREIDKEADPFEYKISKAAVLGLGYGMGAKKFSETTEVELDLAEHVVQTFRAEIIGTFWVELETAFVRAITGRKDFFEHGVFTFRREKPFIFIGLPSGREIAYFRPEIRMEETPWGKVVPKIYYWTEDSQSRKWTLVSTWGGKLTENVDQAIARDIIAGATLRIANRESELGPVVLTVHDELVTEHKDNILDELMAEMCRPVDWAQSLPLAAEGWVGRRFR